MNFKKLEAILNKSLTAELLLIVTTFFWGTTFFLVKSTIEIIPTFPFLTIRFFLASVISLPIFLRQFFRKKIPIRPNFIAGVIIGIFLWISFNFQTIGLQYTSSTVAAFITSLNVIFTPLLAISLFKAPISKRVLITSLAALIGVFLISGMFDYIIEGYNESSVDIIPEMFGNILIIICALAIAFHILFTGKYAPKTDPMALLFFQLLITAFLSAGTMILFQDFEIAYFNPSNWTETVWLTLIVTVLFATTFAYMIQSYYQSKEIVSSSRVALIFSFEPIFAALAGFFVLREILSLIDILGAIIIFLAVLSSHPDYKDNQNEI